MNEKENKYIGTFVPGNINQWKLFKNDDYTIWLAGDNLEKKYDYLIKNINYNEDINKIVIKKIIQNIDDHFGIVCLTKKWAFAAVDCARSYPIFWKKTKDNYIFSPQAKNIINREQDFVDKDQLVAFRMSGYTIGDGTLWNNVKNINPGNFIFLEKKKNFSIEEYFSYKPWKTSVKSYAKLKNLILVREWLKEAQKPIPNFLNEIIVKCGSCYSMLSCSNKQFPLFNGATEINHKDYDSFLKNMKYKFNNKE